MVRELFRFSFKFIYCSMKTTYLIAPSIKAIESETEKNKDKVLLSMTGMVSGVFCFDVHCARSKVEKNAT